MIYNIERIIIKIIQLCKSKKTIVIPRPVALGEELKDKVAFISGGSGGIGLEIAKTFLDSGAKVVISGTNPQKLERIRNELNDEYLKTVVLDYGEPKTFEKVTNDVAKMFGKIDIFVSSSGIHVDRKGLDFLSTTIDEYDSVMGINLRGTYFMCQAVAKYMVSNKISGHILIISSQSALEPSWSPYRLSKLGIDGITRGMGQKLLDHGIIVNAIGPGPTATTMQNKYDGESIYTPLNPIKRFTMPEEVAQYAKMMVSDLGNTIIGQTLYMSGGRGITEIR